MRKVFFIFMIICFSSLFIGCDQNNESHNNNTNGNTTVENEKKVDAVSVKISQYELEMRVGETKQLDYDVLPNNYTSKVYFSSTNSNIAIIDNKGVITAKSVGECNITASTENGLNSSCILKVLKAYKDLSGISLTKYADTIISGETKNYQLILDNQGSVSNVNYTISNYKTVTVELAKNWSEDGKLNFSVKGTEAGTCTITFTVTTPTGKEFIKNLSVEVKGINVSFNEELIYFGFKVKFGKTYEFDYINNRFSEDNGKKCVKIPVTVTNIGESSNSLNEFGIDTFSPKGQEVSMTISAYFDDDICDIKLVPGASASGYLYFLYDGSGEYTMEFELTDTKAIFDIK